MLGDTRWIRLLNDKRIPLILLDLPKTVEAFDGRCQRFDSGDHVVIEADYEYARTTPRPKDLHDRQR